MLGAHCIFEMEKTVNCWLNSHYRRALTVIVRIYVYRLLANQNDSIHTAEYIDHVNTLTEYKHYNKESILYTFVFQVVVAARCCNCMLQLDCVVCVSFCFEYNSSAPSAPNMHSYCAGCASCKTALENWKCINVSTERWKKWVSVVWLVWSECAQNSSTLYSRGYTHIHKYLD